MFVKVVLHLFVHFGALQNTISKINLPSQYLFKPKITERSLKKKYFGTIYIIL